MKYPAKKKDSIVTASAHVLDTDQMKAIWGGYPNDMSNYELADFFGNRPSAEFDDKISTTSK